MRAFALCLLLLPACRTAYACYTPSDRTTGWKAAPLPDGVPDLAAPDDIDQFRGGESAILWDEQPLRFPSYESLGSTELYFPVSDGAQLVEVRFAARLGGARVDARGDIENGSYSILNGDRFQTDRLLLDLSSRDTTGVALTVHHHLRAAPRLVEWQLGRSVPAATWLGGATRTLYYYQPQNRDLMLCSAPHARLGVHRSLLSAQPMRVVLTPTPLTRVLHP